MRDSLCVRVLVMSLHNKKDVVGVYTGRETHSRNPGDLIPETHGAGGAFKIERVYSQSKRSRVTWATTAAT